MSSGPTPRLKRVAVVVAALALAIAVGTLIGTEIGTEIGDKRADDRASRAKEKAERQRAIVAAADRREREREREQERREREQEAPENAIEKADAELLRAAKAGQRDAVARHEARLTELIRRQGTAQPAAEDPVERELDRFPIKQPPLLAQQISSDGDNHVLFVSVSMAHFCLKTASERQRAVRATYQPIARRLRQHPYGPLGILTVNNQMRALNPPPLCLSARLAASRRQQ